MWLSTPRILKLEFWESKFAYLKAVKVEKHCNRGCFQSDQENLTEHFSEDIQYLDWVIPKFSWGNAVNCILWKFTRCSQSCRFLIQTSSSLNFVLRRAGWHCLYWKTFQNTIFEVEQQNMSGTAFMVKYRPVEDEHICSCS